MNTTLTLAEIARIEELLNRLDPDPAPVCRVAGCRHAHAAPAGQAEGVALAA
jgi:hypothetical protein